MRKKTLLKAVSLFACLSILMLSVPGVIASERTSKKFSFNSLLEKSMDMLSMLLPFMNLRANDEQGDTSSDLTSDDDSGKKIKITGTLTSPKKADKDS